MAAGHPITYNQMVVGLRNPPEQRERHDQVFRALADATRRDIVARTMERPYSVSALAQQYPMSFAAVQKHVAVLEDAGLVSKEAVGRQRLVRAQATGLAAARTVLDELEALWRGRMERFGEVLAGESEAETGQADNEGASE